MSMFDLTPAGAFVNTIDTAAKSDSRYREPAQPIEKPRKPIVRNFVMRVIAIFIA